MTEWRWGCIHCGSNGPADSADHASALTSRHWTWACPGTATIYDDTPPIRYDDRGRVSLRGSQGGNGYVQRVARHNAMHESFPDQAPEWTGSFSGVPPS